ncbi:uncharacterized protein ACIGJ3_011163 isoform 2-T2 [Trichechus inunguis]
MAYILSVKSLIDVISDMRWNLEHILPERYFYHKVCHLITWIPCAKKPAVKEEIIIVPGVIDPAHQEEVFSLKKVRRLLPSLHHSDSDCLSKQLSKQAERGKIDATHEIFKEPRNRRELEKRQGPSARANRDRKPSSRDGTLNSDF